MSDDDVIASARAIPGFIDVNKSIYYREWDITFMFDAGVIAESEANRQVRKLIDQFQPNWGKQV